MPFSVLHDSQKTPISKESAEINQDYTLPNRSCRASWVGGQKDSQLSRCGKVVLWEGTSMKQTWSQETTHPLYTETP